MPTRFYFTAAAAPGITPAYNAEWEKTANAVRRLLSQSKLSTATALSSDSEVSASAPYDLLNRQLISRPLLAQTISGTVKGQCRFQEGSADGDFCAAVVIKVVSSDGATVRGILLSYFPASLASEFDSSGVQVNRSIPPSTALTPVEAQEGDCLVVEIGARAFNTLGTAQTYYVKLQDGAAIDDLPEDETTTDDLCPWIEFSQDLLFPDKVQVYQALGQVEYDDPADLQVYQVCGQVEYDLNVAGSGAATLPKLTAAGQGQVVAPVVGAGAATLSELTAAGIGTMGEGAVIGAGAASLAPLTADGEGYLIPPVTGTGEASLGAPTAAGTGLAGVPVTGTIDASLAPLTASGCESLSVEGVGAASLACLTAIGTAKFIKPVTGTGSARLKPLTAYGEIPHLVTKADLITQKTATGGFLFGGPPGDHEVLQTPGTWSIQSTGGFLFGVRSRVVFLFDADLRPFQVIASGGFILGGNTKVTWFDPSAKDLGQIISSGGFLFGGFNTEVNLVDPPAPWKVRSDGGFLLGGEWTDPAKFLTPDIISIVADPQPGGFLLGGQGIIEHLFPEITSIISQGGGFVLSGFGIVDAGDGFSETWALNGFGLEPSLYAGFDFNSYAMFQGQAYGCREDGIYLLEGPDDDGKPIVSCLRLGPLNFGSERQKRLRLIRPGGAEGIAARIAAGGDEEIALQEGDTIPVSRNIEGNEFVLDLQGFTRLGFLEILPLVLMKR